MALFIRSFDCCFVILINSFSFTSVDFGRVEKDWVKTFQREHRGDFLGEARLLIGYHLVRPSGVAQLPRFTPLDISFFGLR